MFLVDIEKAVDRVPRKMPGVGNEEERNIRNFGEISDESI